MDPEALILGGGLAGSALAIHLARAGRPVALIEQHAGPHHKVCGEFLSREALHYLAALDVDLTVLGAVPITHVRLAHRNFLTEAPLPFPALSLTRRTLDEALLGVALQAGAIIHRGHRIDTLTHGDLWQATLSNRITHNAASVFVATGKHDLRDHARPPGLQNDLIAFKQYFRLMPKQTAALASHVELIVFPGGYAGLQPVEGGMTNLCLLIRRSTYTRLGGWLRLLDHLQQHSPHLAARLASAAPILDKPLALSSIPYGHLRASANPAELNLWRLGDQTAVIPSFSGDGMSIALHTAALAARYYLDGRSPSDLQADLYRTLRHQITLATVLSRILVATPALVAATRFFPGLPSRVASATRISPSALL